MTSGKFATTVGYEKLYNPSLQYEDRGRFVDYMNKDQPSRPANFGNIVAINQGRRPLSMSEPTPRRCAPSEVRDLVAKGHLVLDTRSPERFGGGHIPGAFNVQISSPEFEQRVGWVIPPDQPVILVAEDPNSAREGLVKLAFVGLDQTVRGTLEMEAWSEAGLPQDTLPQMEVAALRERLSRGEWSVLDVRETSEWKLGHIDSAHLMNFKVLPARLADLPLKPEQPVAVICATGMRSSTACSILRRGGYRNLCNVTGGMDAWRTAGFPVQYS